MVNAAVLYHGEAEWCDNAAMPFEKPLRRLYDGQIDCHVLPADIFARPDFYHTKIGRCLTVNGQMYKVLIVPGADYIPKAAAEGIALLHQYGMPVFFVDRYPKGLCDSEEIVVEPVTDCPLVSLDNLYESVKALGFAFPKLSPACDRIRILHIGGKEPVFYIVNEGNTAYEGKVTLPAEGSCYVYDAWENCCEKIESMPAAKGTEVKLYVEPLKSRILVFGECDFLLREPVRAQGKEVLVQKWRRSICQSIAYPAFGKEKEVQLPDRLAEEEPGFSGFVRYETSFNVK